MMALQGALSRLRQDWRLVAMTRRRVFPPGVESAMQQKGWRLSEETCLFLGTDHHTYVRALPYQRKLFVSGQSREGGNKWYADLADLVTPGHQPGVLTRILGKLEI